MAITIIKFEFSEEDEKREPRKFSEILIEADKATTYKQLDVLSDELMTFKENYTLAEINFGMEHIIELGREVNNKETLKALFDE